MIHPYAYRTPRLPASLTVEFAVASGNLVGFVRNISPQGLFAEFGEPVLPGTRGRARFRVEHCILELGARVTHAEGFMAGLEFLPASEQESMVLRAVLQRLEALTPPFSRGDPPSGRL